MPQPKRFNHPSYIAKFLSTDLPMADPDLGLRGVSDLYDEGNLTTLYNLATAMRISLSPPERFPPGMWWSGEAFVLKHDTTIGLQEACFRVGVVKAAKNRSRAAMMADNLGLTRNKQGMRPIPNDVYRELMDLGSLSGAFLHKVVTGRVTEFMDDWDWNQPGIEDKKRELYNLMVNIGVADDISLAASRIGIFLDGWSHEGDARSTGKKCLYCLQDAHPPEAQATAPHDLQVRVHTCRDQAV
jgi:hypothetical protein